MCQLPLAKQGSEYHWRLRLLLQGLPEEVPTLQQPLSFTHARQCDLPAHEKLAMCTLVRCTGASPKRTRSGPLASRLLGSLRR